MSLRFPRPAGGNDIVGERHVIPVKVQSRAHGRRHLLAELQVADFDVVPLHADIARVHCRSEALQQVLRDLQVEIAVVKRLRLKNSELTFT